MHCQDNQAENLKVSVITPSYNRGHLIEKTIQSVLNQSYRNIEYIVIDGNSSDNTVTILESYQKDGRLTYISEEDNGMYDAINKGLKMASGDIIAYLNTDDLYFPWSVAVAVKKFSDNRIVDMIYGDSLVVDVERGNQYINIYASHSSSWLPSGGVLCQPTVFLRKKVTDKIGLFNLNYRYLADCEYWLRVNNEHTLIISKIDEMMAIECNHGETFRAKMKENVLNEKRSLMCSFGRDYSANMLKSLLFRLIHVIRKEVTLWEFVRRTRSGCHKQSQPWNHFLCHYTVSFRFANYLLCKFVSNRKKFPRFAILKRNK